MDRLASMAAFVKAVDLGSFAAAAAALDLSAPMVGKHVRLLEERLGVRLINRTTRRQSVTEFGRAYYERCRTVLAEIEATDALAADQGSEPRGKLRVTLPVLFGRRCVAPVLIGLARRYPMLEIELSFTDHLIDLTDSGHDLAVRNLASDKGQLGDQAGVMARRVARQHMLVCAAPSYLKKHGKLRRLDDLDQHQAILYSRAGRVRPWYFPRENGSALAVVPPSRIRLDDLDAIADAAATGMGLAWLPYWLVREHIDAGRLVPLMQAQPGLAYDSYALWLQTPYLPLKVRLAVDALAAALPKMMGTCGGQDAPAAISPPSRNRPPAGSRRDR